MTQDKMKIGDKFRLTDDAIEHYGAEYDQVYSVSLVFSDDSMNPYYDMGVYPAALYESDSLPFALYEWEVIPD